MSLRSMIKALRTPSARWSLGSLFGIGLIVVVASALFVAVELTGRDAFCLVCHSRDVGLEIADHPHGDATAGTSVRCADCHLPKAFGPRVVAKAQAGARDVYSHLTGTIDTPEKFEAARLRLAMKTWEHMNANDSRECRECHDPKTWDLSKQGDRARRYHLLAHGGDRTCIDCHKGLAHTLPEGIGPFDAIEGIDF